MKRTSKGLTILGTMTSLVLGLFLAGCGQNQARETTEIETPPAVEQPVEPEAVIEQRESEAELSARAREIARKEAELDRRMQELKGLCRHQARYTEFTFEVGEHVQRVIAQCRMHRAGWPDGLRIVSTRSNRHRYEAAILLDVPQWLIDHVTRARRAVARRQHAERA